MTQQQYHLLGKTGLRVSRLSLGTMTFGTDWGWGADDASCRDMFACYLNAGGNFIDTADIYTGGHSETMLGRFIAEQKARDRVVLATKFSHNMAPGNPNAGGNGRKNILRAVDASLQRLGTDYIDLYIMHNWDTVTPFEEVIRTLDDLVRAGKIRHIGLSDVPAWYAASMQVLAREHHYEPVSSMQLEYSLLERNIEREHVPLALEQGIGITVWSPLASGLLSGKYPRGQADLTGVGRLGTAHGGHFSKIGERSAAILTELESVAAEAGRSMAQVALNWVANRPAVSSIILGATKLAQFESNLACLDFNLTPEHCQRLDAASQITAQFPGTFFSTSMQQRLSGGTKVSAKPGSYASPQAL
jgi:aryl-alcohol dehydrogenase-like predicted oxidoreductase